MKTMLPHDHPTPDRQHRIYAALTNHCNRSCPWCSMYSSPGGSTFLSKQKYCQLIDRAESFELQLEGGEPTTHPLFWEFVELARANSNCSRLILCTNGTRLPRTSQKLRTWLARLGLPLTIKMSINHHLLDRDSGLLDLAKDLAALCPLNSPNLALVFNVRLRRGVENDDQKIRALVEVNGLTPWSNIFYLQKYGLATEQSEWEEPFIVGENFSLINPDGQNFGSDLIKRSEAMRILP